MSKKRVKERIEMYSEISKMKEVKFYQFTVLYHRKEKIWFLYLEYSTIIVHAQTYTGSDEPLYTVIKPTRTAIRIHSIEKSGIYREYTVYTPKPIV